MSPIVEFLENRLQGYMDEMAAPQRDLHKPDPRMHVCLYFIPPLATGILFPPYLFRELLTMLTLLFLFVVFSVS